MTLEIVRFANHLMLGAPGRLYHNDKFICYTMEKPWIPHETSKGGKPYSSCVPAGEYTLVDYDSARYGKVKILVNPSLDVMATADDRMTHEQRFKCLAFHLGNYSRNFKGCIGAGYDYVLMDEGMGITNTQKVCAETNDLIKNETNINIRWIM